MGTYCRRILLHRDMKLNDTRGTNFCVSVAEMLRVVFCFATEFIQTQWLH
jgi:hypothetical protein